MRNRFALMAAMIALPVATAAAQNVAPRNVISIQPLNAMMTVFAGEYERGLGKAASWGIGATYWDAGDENVSELKYSSADFKVRYYPQGTSLQGFALGGSVGFTQAKETAGSSEASQSGASVGVLLEYQWLMGSKKSFSMALGAGAKALFVDEDQFGADFTARYPTARISIGYAW